MKKIKRDDQVIVLTGKDKGKRGSVTRVLDDGRVFVSGINMVKRHTKANPQLNRPGGIIEREAAVQSSNVAIFNKVTGKPDRVGFKFMEDGSKVRIYKSTSEEIDI